MNEFNQYQHKVGFTSVTGNVEQVSIGDITEFDDHIVIKVLPGCSRDFLDNFMYDISNRTDKIVKAIFQNEEIIINPGELGEPGDEN